MNKKEAEAIFRWRQTLLDNFDSIKLAVKKSRKANALTGDQLDLFGAGLEVAKEFPKLIPYEGYISLIASVNKEVELLGVPVLYNPIDDYDMYKELYCTHNVVDLFDLTEDEEGIVVLDRVTEIDYRVSKRGNDYCKLFLSNLGQEYYVYLFGKFYRDYIQHIFKDEIYLFKLKYSTPTKDYNRDSISCEHLKNIKDVDIDTEYDRLLTISKPTEMNEPWMIKNRKK